MTDLREENLAREIARIAEDKKAQDVVILEVSELTTVTDYFVIMSGQNEVQVKAIAREIEEELSEQGLEPYRQAGKDHGRWILLDYRDTVVHVFHRQERSFYDLERLWADAEEILEKESG